MPINIKKSTDIPQTGFVNSSLVSKLEFEINGINNKY